MTVPMTPRESVPIIDADRFEVSQRFRMIVNQYDVTALDGSSAGPVAYVHQKRMKLKEEIQVWTDSSRSALLCTIKARRVLEFRSAYDVTAPDGTSIGVLQKVAGASLLRSTWTMHDASGKLATVTETSVAIALLRRFMDVLVVIPIIGPFLALLPIPYGFTFLDPANRPIATHKREFTLRDRYTLDMTGDRERRIDRRLAIAMAVCLDALQGR